MSKLNKEDAYDLLPPVHVVLTHSRRKALRFVREHGIEDAGLLETDAQTVTVVNGGARHNLVLMEASKDLAPAQEYALLAHEAVHVAQDYFEGLGENSPSSEFEAYVVQSIFQLLLTRHLDWKERHDAVRGI